jgi:hypothetical protein
VAFPGSGQRVGYLVEDNLLCFIRTGCRGQVTREGYPLVAVNALAKPGLCVIPTEVPMVEAVFEQELACS